MPDNCPICYQLCENGQQYIECASCLCWVHQNNQNNCSGLTDSEFKIYSRNSKNIYKCDKCKSLGNDNTIITLPFASLDESSWLNFNEIKSTPKIPDTKMNSTEIKNFISQCGSIQNLIDTEDTDSDNLSPKMNSKYYDIKQFNSLKDDLPSSFGLFHVNLTSLNCHIDDLKLILSQLYFSFDVVVFLFFSLKQYNTVQHILNKKVTNQLR